MLTIGSLFSGIGGLELGLEQAGLGPVLYQVEIDPFCRAVLAKHWPSVPRHEDVRSLNAHALPRVDLICGGFPCQNVSSAGKREGLGGAKSGLWYEFIRIIREARPRFVVVENVASGAKRWLCQVRGQLESSGYRTRALGITAAELGGLHRRARVFVVAHAQRDKLRQQPRRRGGPRGRYALLAEIDGAQWPASDAHGEGEHALPKHAEVASAPKAPSNLEGVRGVAGGGWPAEESAGRSIASRSVVADHVFARREGSGPDATYEGREGFAAGIGWPPESDVVRIVHGLSGGLDGRKRRARLRALGNAVYPPQARVVGEVIRMMLEAEEIA